jgi:hypothetical protein
MSYKVTYDGNGSDGGAAPVDLNSYNAGVSVNVADVGTIRTAPSGYKFCGTARTGARITPSRTPSSIARSFGTDEYTVPPTMDALMSTGCRREQD